MKHLTKKNVLLVGGSIVFVCLAIVIGYMFATRSVKRAPTQEELAMGRVYHIDWQEETGLTGTDLEIILSLCTEDQEQTIGNNVYQCYADNGLSRYLPNFHRMSQIAMADDVVNIQYFTSLEDLITLTYNHAGNVETLVYDSDTDLLYYEHDGQAEVWTNFRHGFQWGE